MPRTPDAARAAKIEAESRLSHKGRMTPEVRAKISATQKANAVKAGLNSHALVHGAHASVTIREPVHAEMQLIFARAPYLNPRRDGPLVEQAARLIIRMRRMDEYLTDEGRDLNPTISQSTFMARLEANLTRVLSELGLSPTSAARLGIDLYDLKARAAAETQHTLARYAPRTHKAPIVEIIGEDE